MSEIWLCLSEQTVKNSIYIFQIEDARGKGQYFSHKSHPRENIQSLKTRNRILTLKSLVIVKTN